MKTMQNLWLAVVVAVIVVASSFAAAGFAAASTRAGSPVLAHIDMSAPLSGPLKQEVVAAASAAAVKAHLKPAVATAAVSKVVGETPAEILASAGFSPQTIRALDSCGPLAGSCGANLGAGLGGCAVGGLIGAGGAGVGAGVGCVLGAVAGLLIFQFGLSQAGAQNNLALATPWAIANIAAASNDWNLTETSYENLLSALNFSEMAFQRMADNAALLQLGNASFNVPQDEYQAGIDSQFGTILQSYASQVQQPFALLQGWTDAQAAPGAVFSAASLALGQAPVGVALHPAAGQYIAGTFAGAFFGSLTLSSNATVYIPPGTHWLVGTGGGAWAIHPVFGKGWTSVTPVQISVGSTLGLPLYNWSYNFSAGYYQLGTVTAGNSLQIPGGAFPATSVTTDMSGWALPADRIAEYAGSGASYDGVASVATGQSHWFCAGVTPCTAITYTALATNRWIPANFGPSLGNLAFQAATNGEVYWSFLRSIGYTSISQIPPDCIVPAPYQVLPSALNLSGLTLTQAESLYLAWLEGLGTFYNTSLNTASFCGTQSGHHFNLNNTIWGNLFINATGYVYLNNGTSPISPNGKALSTEVYGNRSTWALAKVQLLLMPTLATVSIPIGQSWAVPAADPVRVYAIQPGLMLQLTGNGTSTGASFIPMVVVPGDSLYLTSCTIGGVPQSNCTVTVQTIKTTTTNLTCLGGGSSSPASCTNQSVGGTFGGFPNPFSWLANLLSGLLGGGPLGTLLGGIVSALIILAVILVLVYVAAVEVQAWGGKKRGGGSTAAMTEAK